MEITTKKGRKVRNLAGERFGKLVALKVDRNIKGRVYWLCRCDCGNYKAILANSLVRGLSHSCGCAHKGRKVKPAVRIKASEKGVNPAHDHFDDDWMFAGQRSMPNKPLRTRNGDWI